MEPDVMILVFWVLSFKPSFSLSFTFIKRLFVPLHLSADLSLLIFLLAILIPACDSSNPVVCIMYTAYKINKEGGIQPCRISYIYVNISSLSDLNPMPPPLPHIKVITEQQAEHPLLYSRFPLAIHFTHGRVDMSIPISQFIPSPFPHNPTDRCPHICFLHLCPYCPEKGHYAIFLDSTHVH